MRVELSFYAWQARIVGSPKEGPVVLEEQVAEGITFDGLLQGLIARYPGLQGALIDPASGGLYDYVVVMLNGGFLDLAKGGEVHLKDGDKVQFLPFLAGG